MSDLPPGSIDPYAVPAGGQGFAPGTIVAHVLETAGAGNRVFITSQADGHGGSVGVIEIFTGGPSATGEVPASLTATYNAGGTPTEITVLEGGSLGTESPYIALQGQVNPVSDPVSITLGGDTVKGTAFFNQAGQAGNIPMVIAATGVFAGTAYDATKLWPMIQVFQFTNLVVSAGGQITIPFPQAFPNGCGVFLPFIQAWSAGGPYALQQTGSTDSSYTGFVLKTTTAGTAPSGTTISGTCLAIGW